MDINVNVRCLMASQCSNLIDFVWGSDARRYPEVTEHIEHATQHYEFALKAWKVLMSAPRTPGLAPEYTVYFQELWPTVKMKYPQAAKPMAQGGALGLDFSRMA